MLVLNVLKLINDAIYYAQEGQKVVIYVQSPVEQGRIYQELLTSDADFAWVTFDVKQCHLRNGTWIMINTDADRIVWETSEYKFVRSAKVLFANEYREDITAGQPCKTTFALERAMKQNSSVIYVDVEAGIDPDALRGLL